MGGPAGPTLYTLDQYLTEAPKHSTLASLAEAFDIKPTALREHLRLRGWREQVKQALSGTAGGYQGEVATTSDPAWWEQNTHVPLPMPEVEAEIEELQSLQDIVSHLESRSRKQQNQIRKLQGLLYDRNQNVSLIKQAAREALSNMQPPPSVKKPVRDPMDEEWECHAPLADVHAGLLVWRKESWRGEDYDTEISAQRIREHGERVADWIASQDGVCTIVHRTDLGDILHSLTEATVSGTPLQVDGRPLKVWREVIRGEIEAIEALRKVCGKVQIRRVPGNHDGVQADVLSEYLDAWYRNDDDVEVFITSNEHNHFIVGDTLHVLTHGKRISSSISHKAKASFEVIARETAGEDYWDIKKIKVYFGHLHNPAVERQGRHMELIRLPSLAEPDQFAQSLYFSHDPEARAFRLDQSGDIELEYRLNF